jgi:hypothetical protein
MVTQGPPELPGGFFVFGHGGRGVPAPRALRVTPRALNFVNIINAVYV